MRYAIIVIFALLVGCAPIIEGSGEIIEDTRDLETFSSIRLEGQGNIHLIEGEDSQITIRADDNLLEHIETRIDAGRLIIGTRGTRIAPSEPIIYEITAPSYERVDIAGAGDITTQESIRGESLEIRISGLSTVHMDVEVERLESTISGSGRIEYRGTSREHDLTITGLGNVDAPELRTEETRISITGSGEARVHAESLLDVTIAGSGTVYYLGEPRTRERITGSGDVRPYES